MQTALLPDALDTTICEGDIVINDSGKAFFVDETENSFIRQGFLKVRQVRYSRARLISDGEHHYVQARFTVAIPTEELPRDLPDIRRLYQEKTAAIRFLWRW